MKYRWIWQRHMMISPLVFPIGLSIASGLIGRLFFLNSLPELLYRKWFVICVSGTPENRKMLIDNLLVKTLRKPLAYSQFTLMLILVASSYCPPFQVVWLVIDELKALHSLDKCVDTVIVVYFDANWSYLHASHFVCWLFISV